MQSLSERWSPPQHVRAYLNVYKSKGILLSLCAVLLIGAFTTVMQMRSINELKRLASEQQSVASNALLLNDIQANVVDAETGQRGYLLTGNPAYLQPYNAALPQMAIDFKKLRQMPQTKQDSAAINTLQSTVNQKLAELRDTLSAMNTGGLSSAVAIVTTNKGKALMDGVRSQVSTIESRQGNSLSQYRKHVLDQINVYQGVLVTVRVSALLLVGIGLYLIGKALYQRYELERSKGDFIDIAAHQLRTPASVVKLHLGAMLGGYTGRLTPKQKKFLRSAYGSNEHAIQIIEDVLRVAKVDNGDTILHPRSENIQRLLNDAIKSVRPALKIRKQKIVRQLPKQPVHTVLDAMYVRMVVENLLDNASKYSPEGSTITLSLASSGQKHSIRVKDQGIGIAKRDVNKLFKKFVRIENGASDNIMGTGLGLYWSQRIAELHGGKITVKSKLKSGSTFTLELPAREST